MKRWLLPATVALTLALLGGGAAVATGEADGIDEPTTLRLLDVADKFEFVDLGKADVSPGDLFIFENVLRNRADTKTLGRFVGACTALISPGLTSCRGTLELPRGTIEVAGAVDFSAPEKPIFAAVTGGTKRFKEVDGQLRLSPEIRAGVRRATVELLP